MNSVLGLVLLYDYHNNFNNSNSNQTLMNEHESNISL